MTGPTKSNTSRNETTTNSILNYLRNCPDCRGYCTTSAKSFYVCSRHWMMLKAMEADKRHATESDPSGG
jgi:hypothetical protein